jgi:hypothetical protein
MLQRMQDPFFSLPEDALEIGYEIGSNLRRARVGKSFESRQLGIWARDKVDSPNFVFWQMGFRAGFRGSPKPGYAVSQSGMEPLN